jgi:hypothetical protein
MQCAVAFHPARGTPYISLPVTSAFVGWKLRPIHVGANLLRVVPAFISLPCPQPVTLCHVC